MSLSDLTPTDKTIRRLLLKHSLERIDMLATEKTVTVKALPKSYHPLVGERREQGLRAAAENGGGSIALSEAQTVTSNALRLIATGHGTTLDDALFDLERALKAL